jgi:multidrug efflux pump subunit AcrA (membrane-fusion protein)
MKLRSTLCAGATAGMLALSLAACGAPAAVTLPPAPTAAPASVGAPADTATSAAALAAQGVSSLGEVKVDRDVGLLFPVQGIVQDVKVKEGDAVKKGDILAVLDTRPFDQKVQQAEVALEIARAQQSGLNDSPRDADVAAAQAQVQQAQIALGQARAGQAGDVKAAQASLDAAQANLQATKDKLSAVKTQAELAMQSATQALTQAQARYAQAKYNWEYAQSSGNDPLVPQVTTSTGKKVDNKLSDGQMENYYAAFVAAESTMRAAESQLATAKIGYDSARQAEVTGIQAAEQAVTAAQATLDKLKVPAGIDRVAAAKAALSLAEANLRRLNPDPRPAQLAAASGGVQQAQIALDQARLNREYAELRAPFDATVAEVNVNPGDTVGLATSRTAVRLVNLGALRFEAQVSDTLIAQVKVGETARVTLDGIPGTVFTGVVSYIAPTPTISGSTRMYLVRVALDQHDDLRAGLTGQVQFQK